MGLSHAPRVITDGLVLGLDAANTRSYVGSGTTWTDLIGSNNGTLTNGPVFTQEPKLEPFGGAGSVSFDGSDDYLECSNTVWSDLAGVNTSFTIEAWIYPTNVSSQAGEIIGITNSGSTSSVSFRILPTYALRFGNWGSGYTSAVSSSNAVTQNAWNHVVASKDGSTLRLFVNGNQVASVTVTDGTLPTFSRNTQIGGRSEDNATKFIGYISNLRVVNGTALYTSNFTPPRKKLEVTSDTILLTCQKGPIRDRSSSAHAITIAGDAKSISGASYFEFDGTNHYADLPDSNDFAVGTSGDITIEAWINSDDWSGDGGYVCLYQCGDGTGLSIMFALGRLRLQNYGTEFSLGSTTLSTGQWYNIVAVRKDGILTGYVNGSVENAAVSNTVDFSQNGPRIGQWKGLTGYHFDGKISNFKIYKNKGLTAAEVKQNYRNTKSRYGL